MTDKKYGSTTEEQVGWRYKPKDDSADISSTTQKLDVYTAESPSYTKESTKSNSVEWTASEFIEHQKDFGWYAALLLLAITLAGIIYLVTKSVFSSSMILVMATFLGISAAHKPRTVAYRLDDSGIKSGQNFWPYRKYKSFSMMQHGPFASVVLLPLKRFAVPVNMYLAPESQREALEALSTHLPLERGKLDWYRRLLTKIRY